MWVPKSINIRFALALATYHRGRGTRVPDGDLGFRCTACGQPLVAREGVSEKLPAHFDHFDVNSTCRLTRFVTVTTAARSDLLERYLTGEPFLAVMLQLLTRTRGDSDEPDLDGDARVPSPLRPVPFDRSASASVDEPDDDHDVIAVAAAARGLHHSS